MLNEILGSAARFNQLLTRKFGLTGGAPSPQITPEIAPTFSWVAGPEDAIPAGETLASAVISVAGVAAKRSVAMLSNPTGSNLLVVVEHFDIQFGATGGFVNASVLKLDPLAGLPAAGGICIRDTRVKSDPAGSATTRPPAARISKDNEPPTILTANILRRQLPAFGYTEYYQPIVLSPGWSLQVYESDNNLALDAAFAWREVPLQAGEVGPF